MENYIACDSDTLSEIVVPCFGKGNVLRCVFDLDSDKAGMYDQQD